MKIYHDPPNTTALPPLAMPGGAFKDVFNNFTERERQEFQRAYYACVSFMDAQVGRLMATLDKLKLWDQTLVIFSGDNGYHHNERNWWNKNTLFERSCRVPLIIAAPGAKRGEVCRSLVEFVDLYPTLADYCGVQPPHKLAGETLRPLLQNPAGKGREAAFTLVVRGGKNYGQTVRTEGWRLIQWSDGNLELYDEIKDPEEAHDVSSRPENAARVSELKTLLKRIGPFEPSPDAKPSAIRGAEKSTALP